MRTIDQIETLIARGDLKEALAGLSEIVARSEDLTRHRNAVITLSARYHQLQRRRISGLISSGEAQITENQIRYNTLELIDMVRREGGGEEHMKVNKEENTDSRSTGKTEEVRPNAKVENKGKIIVLFFGSSPVDQKRTYMEIELQAIKDNLLREGFKDRLEIHSVTDVNSDNVMTYILDVRPNIIHFSCHGSEEGLSFNGKDKKSVLIPTQKLEAVFKLFREVVGCVVLNACYSELPAKAIRKHISYVLGTTGDLPAGAAVKFSSKFYEALGQGQEIEFAYEFAKVGADLAGSNADMVKLI